MLCGVGIASADNTPHAATLSQDDLWRRTIDLVTHGDFEGATETFKDVRAGGQLTERILAWLEEYEAKQAARRELNRADFEKYVGYAKARIERKEYRDALSWALGALDCAEDREAFLQSDWLLDLVNDSLTAAGEFRQEQKWRQAWYIYSQLSGLFEREPRYEKLEREMLTHLRLDTMFKEDSYWEERIEKVRWKDAERALVYVDKYYIDPVDFRSITENGLEQLLLLTESATAREQFVGLRNDDDRRDFENRMQKRLDQVKDATLVNLDACIDHFKRVVRHINPETIKLPTELIVYELMRGAFEPLDDFTTIIWPKDAEEFDKHTRGDFVGVGISIIKNRADEVEVVTPLEDSSAYRAGIQAGDIITHVNGDSLKGFSLNKVVETITGPEGTMVTLAIRRDGEAIEFSLERANVKIRSVKGVLRNPDDEERWDHWVDRERGVGYIRVTNFQRNTVEDVDNVLSELVGLKGLILDLRGNPGGLLDSAWQLSSRFLKRDDVIVSTKGRIPSENHVFPAPGNGPYSDIPLVVLVDERSASASEIVSGAVRDNYRGIVVGERTFGKFSVQNLISLSRSGAKLKITTAGYYLPSGVSLQRGPDSDEWGVEPDIPVRLVNKEVLNAYKLWREANLLGPPKSTDDKPVTDTEDDEAKTGEAKTDTVDTGDGEAGSDTAKTDGEAADKADTVEQESGATEGTGAEKSAKDDDASKEDKLPPLEQPDENNRPKQDPQLDTALLLMRVLLAGESYPTLATADTKENIDSVRR